MGRPGRPSEYSEELAEQICELVASGKSRRQVAEGLNLSESTIRLWQKQHDPFSAQYARAEAFRAEWFFERGNEIAMSITTPEEAQVARVQLDWLKWSASKLGPKKFSDKTPGDSPDNPIHLGLQIISSVPRPKQGE